MTVIFVCYREWYLPTGHGLHYAFMCYMPVEQHLQDAACYKSAYDTDKDDELMSCSIDACWNFCIK